MARRLGLLGPAIVIVGVAVAVLGAWYVVHARPKPGAMIDTFGAPEAGEGASIVIRAEQGGERSFVELRGTSPFSGDHVVWQALIPHYAGSRGRPAVAWSRDALTIRVEREGRAEVFALAMHDSAKLGGLRLAREHEPIATQTSGPITLTDHERSYEFVGGDGWHELVAIDLASGIGLWKVELGAPSVRDGGVEGGLVWVEQAGKRRRFDGLTGHEVLAAN